MKVGENDIIGVYIIFIEINVSACPIIHLFGNNIMKTIYHSFVLRKKMF